MNRVINETASLQFAANLLANLTTRWCEIQDLTETAQMTKSPALASCVRGEAKARRAELNALVEHYQSKGLIPDNFNLTDLDSVPELSL